MNYENFAKIAQIPYEKFQPEFTKYLIQNTKIWDSQNPCNFALQHSMNNFLSENSIFTLTANTGLSSNELGDYKNCLKAGWRYFTMMVIYRGTPIFNNGVCLPSVCRTEHLADIRKGLAHVLYILTKFDIGEDAIWFTDIKEMNETYTKIDKYGYITVGLIFAMILLCIIGTLLTQILGKNKDTVIYKISKCFDIHSNFVSIFYGENTVDPNLNILNGVRVLGMYWIIAGHVVEVMANLLVPLINPKEAFYAILDNREYSFYLGGTLSVDIFFFLTAFLGVLVTDHQLKTAKSNKIITILMLILHRFIRLIPIYGLTILFFQHVLKLFYDGPVYYVTGVGSPNCEDNWIWNLLFINNFVNPDKQCLGWSWYLSNDFQMYLLIPLLCVLYEYRKLFGFIAIGAMFILSCIAQIIVFNKYGLSMNLIGKGNPHMRSEYYIKPYCRINPFLIGILFAWLYQLKNKDDFPMITKINKFFTESKIIRISLIIVGLISMYCCVFLYYDFYKATEDKSFTETVLYAMLSRPGFIIALLFIIYPTFLGKNRIIQAALGNELFGMLSKITFAAYMFHPIVVMFWYASSEESVYFKGWKVVMIGIESFILSYVVALLLAVIIEYPIMQISKEFLRPSKVKREIMKSDENGNKTNS